MTGKSTDSRRVPTAPVGHGIGVRRQHFTHLLEHGPHGVDWMEIISENHFEPGGRPWAVLERVRAEVPVVMHGVSLAIGDIDGVRPDYLDQLAELIDRLEPALVTDHLCWGGYGRHHSHDLLPLPCTVEALNHVVEQVCRVQDRLQRQILLENPSSYVAFRASDMPEWTFLSEIAQRADCGILLDVNNIYVSANNHGFSAKDYVDAIPRDRVGQIHLAGHSDKGTFLFDSHVGPVPDPVWDLYRYTVQTIGPVPTLVEWDADVPDYEAVVAESARARSIEAECVPDAPRDVPAQAADRAAERAPELRGLQNRFWRYMVAPSGVASARATISEDDPGATPLSSWIDLQDEDAAIERLDVYANMYFFRLRDILAEDFSKVHALIGADLFHNLATDYLLECPPNDRNIRNVGARLPAFIADHSLSNDWPFVADLARFEWARISIFDRADATPLTENDLAAVPNDAWPTLRMQTIPASTMLELRYPTHQLSDVDTNTTLEPADSTVLFWRRDFRIYHRTVTEPERSALLALSEGSTFAATCEHFAGDADDIASAATAAHATLLRWIGDELLQRASTKETEE